MPKVIPLSSKNDSAMSWTPKQMLEAELDSEDLEEKESAILIMLDGNVADFGRLKLALSGMDSFQAYMVLDYIKEVIREELDLGG